MKRICIAAALTIAVTPAAAMTGAELLTFSPDYARGYVWGTVNLMASLTGHPVVTANSKLISDCLVKSGVTDQAIYLATVAHIRDNPQEMTLSPIVAINAVLTRVCPSPHIDPSQGNPDTQSDPISYRRDDNASGRDSPSMTAHHLECSMGR